VSFLIFVVDVRSGVAMVPLADHSEQGRLATLHKAIDPIVQQRLQKLQNYEEWK
jgi:hypothetical protein